MSQSHVSIFISSALGTVFFFSFFFFFFFFSFFFLLFFFDFFCLQTAAAGLRRENQHIGSSELLNRAYAYVREMMYLMYYSFHNHLFLLKSSLD